MSKILILAGPDRCDTFSIYSYEDAVYWIRRRYEKEGHEFSHGWIVDDSSSINVEQIYKDYDSEMLRLEIESNERKECELFERLKQKYGGGAK